MIGRVSKKWGRSKEGGALLQLLKGETTTMPEAHSGEDFQVGWKLGVNVGSALPGYGRTLRRSSGCVVIYPGVTPNSCRSCQYDPGKQGSR